MLCKTGTDLAKSTVGGHRSKVTKRRSVRLVVRPRFIIRPGFDMLGRDGVGSPYQNVRAEAEQKGRTTPLRCTREPTVDCAPSCTSDAISSCPSPLTSVPNSSSRPDLADDAACCSRKTSTFRQLFSALHLYRRQVPLTFFFRSCNVFPTESAHIH